MFDENKDFKEEQYSSYSLDDIEMKVETTGSDKSMTFNLIRYKPVGCTFHWEIKEQIKE